METSDLEILASQNTSQQADSEPRSRWLSWVLAGILTVLGMVAGWVVVRSQPVDPYTQEVLELPGDVERGSGIFMMNCSTCHGVDAAGRVGPSLKDVGDRKSKRQLVEQVVSGKTPPMPQFQPNPQDMADLLSYLQTL